MFLSGQQYIEKEHMHIKKLYTNIEQLEETLKSLKTAQKYSGGERALLKNLTTILKTIKNDLYSLNAQISNGELGVLQMEYNKIAEQLLETLKQNNNKK